MPSRFLIRCKACRWSRYSTGTQGDLSDLKEVKNPCSTCGKPRRFVCPECRHVAVMTRVHE